MPSMALLANSKPPSPMAPPISVMTFNVENLFDTTHDVGKNDFQYLPLEIKKKDPQHNKNCQDHIAVPYLHYCYTTDWNNEILKAKMAALSRVILQYEGKGPDILVLEEVENLAVVSALNKVYLGPSEYKTVLLLEGSDQRGIDVAILSRFPLAKPGILHASKEKRADNKESRSILEANLLIHGSKVTVFAVHLPSQAHPKQTRVQMIDFLNKLGSKAAEYSDLVIAAGDFNINSLEGNELFRKNLGAYWYVSHIEGCKQCLGTYYYRADRSWNFLDAILVLRETSDKPKPNRPAWRLDPKSVVIVNTDKEQSSPEGQPKRFRAEKNNYSGVSDHWPVAAKIIRY